MRALITVVGLAASMALCACSGDDSKDDTKCEKPGTKEFAAECTSNCDCASEVCFTFGDGTQTCTQTCTSDDQCPAGSQGKKCNSQGYCRT